MADEGFINRTIGVALALVLLFTLLTTVILPAFSTSYSYCQALKWEGANGDVYTNCTTRYTDSFNSSYVNPSGTSYTDPTLGITAPLAAGNPSAKSFCLNCATAGGYRTTNQGLLLLTLVVGIVGFALYFFGRIKF